MELRRHESAEEFLAHAGGFLSAREAEHNLILGLSSRLQVAPLMYGAPAYFAVVEEGGRVVGVSMRTPPPGTSEEFVDHREEDPDGGIVLWEDGGAVVSMAGFGGRTPSGTRIGPVYTPPDLRGRGYASALTAALTQRLLDGGLRFCFLFTDLANPTSNSIYQRIGYEPVSDVGLWSFR